jgi:hypothetical protein
MTAFFLVVGLRGFLGFGVLLTFFLFLFKQWKQQPTAFYPRRCARVLVAGRNSYDDLQLDFDPTVDDSLCIGHLPYIAFFCML